MFDSVGALLVAGEEATTDAFVRAKSSQKQGFRLLPDPDIGLPFSGWRRGVVAEQDVRWKQRFANYKNAYQTLVEAVALAQTRSLTNLENQGLIQSFEYTHELAWATLKDYLEFYGHTGLIGSRDSTREAFKRGLIDDGEVWMDMIRARNLTSYAYDSKMADAIQADIRTRFFPAFQAFTTKFSDLAERE